MGGGHVDRFFTALPHTLYVYQQSITHQSQAKGAKSNAELWPNP